MFATSYAATYLSAFAIHLGGWFGFATVYIAALISAAAIVAFYKWWVRYAELQCHKGEGAAQR